MPVYKVHVVDYMFVSLPKPYLETLIPIVMVFGDGPVGDNEV